MEVNTQTIILESQIVLKGEDRPTQIENINYADTLFYLQARIGTKSSVIRDRADDPLLKKQIEILTEIIESESKYLDDLKLIQTGFMEPVKQLLNSEEMHDIFHNLGEIISVHETVDSLISASSSNDKSKISKIIACFCGAVNLKSIILGEKV